MILSVSKKYLSGLVLCMQLFVCSVFTASVLAEENTPASTGLKEQTRAAYLDPEQKKQMALADTLKEHEKVWLDVQYPETEVPVKVLAIAKNALIADKQGAILLLHDKEQHADWPQVIRPLRTTLPKYGWFTLAVNLPDEIRVQLPERDLAPKRQDQINLTAALKKELDSGARSARDSGSKAEDQTQLSAANTETGKPAETPETSEAEEGVDINLAASDAKPKIPYQVRASSHIEKAMEYLKNQNFQNIVLLAYRHSADLAFQYIKAHQGELTSPGFALILMEPVLPESYLLDITEWFGASFKPPILDIVDSGNLSAEESAELRKLAFGRAGVQVYRQIFLPVSNSQTFHDELSRRIRLWLENAAPGMSVTQ